MSTADLTLAEMAPLPVFKRATLGLIQARLTVEEQPLAAHPSLLFEVYAGELSYEKLEDAIIAFFEGTASNSLFARLSTYPAFLTEQQRLMSVLYPPDRVEKSMHAVNQSRILDFLNDYTRTVQFDEAAVTRYDQLFAGKIVRWQIQKLSWLSTRYPSMTNELLPLILNIVDIAIHERGKNDFEPLPASVIEWIENLFIWFHAVFTWRESALSNLH